MNLNFPLPLIPQRDNKPRNNGLTMVMDKGLSMREAENIISSCSDFIDLVKFGFGTSLICPELEEKIKLYKEAKIRPYFGGTLFEIFLVRDKIEDFKRFIDSNKLDLIEISDGSIKLSHEQKLEFIAEFSKNFTILSEVGSKIANYSIPDQQWIEMSKNELAAGAWKVIAEAREAGNVGIYKPDGSANKELISSIIDNVGADKILWEAPNKNQQVWFIKLLGANVNLGNIASNDIIPLETLRLGLRGDTFFQFLPSETKDKYIQI